MDSESIKEKFYHVSSTENREGILGTGLKPQTKMDVHIARTPAVFMFDNIEHANYWSHWQAIETQKAVDIWEIAVPSTSNLVRDTHPEMEEFGAWKSNLPIPSSWIRVAVTLEIPKSWEPPPFTPLPTQTTKVRKAMP